MLICPNCKKQFGDGEMFCDNCGTKLAAQQPQQPYGYAPQQPQQPYGYAPQQAPQGYAPQQQAPYGYAPQQPQQAYAPQQPQQQPPQGYAPQQPQQQPPQGYAPQQPQQQPPQGYAPEQPQQQPPQGYAPEQPQQQPPQGYAPQPAGMAPAAQSGGMPPFVTKALDTAKGVFKKVISLPKKWLIAGGAGIVALIALIVILVLVLGGSDPNYALYIKDGELFYSDFEKKPAQITANLGDVSSLSDNVKFSEDGTLIFYPDKLTTSSWFSLYMRDTTKPTADAVKIATDIIDYEISEDGAYVVVQKNDGNLYLFDTKKKDPTKVSGSVSDFYASADAETIFFTTYEGTLYSYEKGKEKVKIDSDVSDVEFINEDFDLIYYTKQESEANTYTLFNCELGGEKQKILSGAANIVMIYEDGEVYFYKSEEVDVKYSDYVTDDCKEADGAMVEPEYPDYPYYWDYETEEEYNAAVEAYDKALEDYYAAYEEYQKKLQRDYLRGQLENTTKRVINTLYFFDGKDSIKVTDNYSRTVDRTSEETVILVAVTSSEKVKLSEINDLYNVFDNVKTDTLVAVGAEKFKITKTDAKRFMLNEDGDTVYFIADIEEDGKYGTLYAVEIKDNGISDPAKYDSDVYASSLAFTEDGLVYYKDISTETGLGDLYFDQKKVDSDVPVGSASYIAKTELLVYATDYSGSKCTLKVYDGKAKKVAEDVSSLGITAAGDILYLADVSSTGKGDLYLYQDGKIMKLDTDVTHIINTYTED